MQIYIDHGQVRPLRDLFREASLTETGVTITEQGDGSLVFATDLKTVTVSTAGTVDVEEGT